MRDGDFIKLGVYEDVPIYNNYYRLYSEDELYRLFPDQEIISGLNFRKWDYAILSIDYASCDENTIRPVDYSIDDNLLTVEVDSDNDCSFCVPRHVYYLLQLEKHTYFNEVNYEYNLLNNMECALYYS